MQIRHIYDKNNNIISDSEAKERFKTNREYQECLNDLYSNISPDDKS